MLNKAKNQNKGSKFLMAAATLTPMFGAALPQAINSPVVQNIVANADETGANTATNKDDALNQSAGISKDGKVKDVTYDTHAKNSANINDNGVGEGGTSQTSRYSPVNTQNSLTGKTGSSASSNASSNTSSATSSSATSGNSSNASSGVSSNASSATSSSAASNSANSASDNQSSASDTKADTKQVVDYINQHSDPKLDMSEDATLANVPANTKVQTYAKEHGFTQNAKVQAGQHALNVYYNPTTKQFLVSEDDQDKPLTLSQIMGVLNLKHNNASDANGNGSASPAGGVSGTSVGLPGSGSFGAGGLAQTNTQSNQNGIALSALGLLSLGLMIGLSGDKLKLKN